ncbi:MAG TPA: hypothetical protein VFV78_08300 [Vicinamibacterales bacterium]|nr:hypothetical protein [Vicinamibacterales bacterium]
MKLHSVPFYREVLRVLTRSDVPFLVGGAFAFARHAAIDRQTKDLDLMIEEHTWPRLARVLRAGGIHTRRTFPHWLGKALDSRGQVDIIYNNGAGLSPVDARWFEHAVPAAVLGFRVRVCPVEELIWSKAFVMERERFDGSDVLHLIRAQGQTLDWRRLRQRFTGHEAVLRAHLILFKYVYPSETHLVPDWLDSELCGLPLPPPSGARLCRGTLLSRAQYLVDVESLGYADARLPPYGTMSAQHWLTWTNAIDAPQTRIRATKRRTAPGVPTRRQSRHRRARVNQTR